MVKGLIAVQSRLSKDSISAFREAWEDLQRGPFNNNIVWYYPLFEDWFERKLKKLVNNDCRKLKKSLRRINKDRNGVN